ncbi:hypothetical protein IV203_001116 [Nitzschia inconspicua]|uniref:Uncharacterized protein n=1 Tax=Nitzschia inconspicua TaxID=303405 RepID=A0A9K3L7P1_9STRA|nr:hypothetical protein IV203_001116 [Nitzschia inconspicua]
MNIHNLFRRNAVTLMIQSIYILSVMCVIGIDALKTFLGANRDRPFAHARLKRVLEAIRDPAAPNIEEPAGVPDIDQEETWLRI